MKKQKKTKTVKSELITARAHSVAGVVLSIIGFVLSAVLAVYDGLDGNYFMMAFWAILGLGDIASMIKGTINLTESCLCLNTLTDEELNEEIE